AEFGVPQWAFRMSTYGCESERRVICTYCERGNWRLASLDTATGKLEPIETSYTDISNVRVSPRRVLFSGGSPTEPQSIVQLDLATRKTEVLRRSTSVDVDSDYLSIPRAIEFPTEDDLTAHAFFYPPRNRDYGAPAGERPPLIVISHGGPTG